MYYEEKMINGVMYYRSDPREGFKPYTLEQLSSRYSEAVKDATRLRGMIQYASDAPDDPEAIKKILGDALAGKNGAE